MNLTVTTLDGVRHEAHVLPIDMVIFERAFKTSLGELGDSPKVEHLLFLAHSALKRAGEAGPDFDAWLATVGEMPEGEPEVPLAQAAS